MKGFCLLAMTLQAFMLLIVASSASEEVFGRAEEQRDLVPDDLLAEESAGGATRSARFIWPFTASSKTLRPSSRKAMMMKMMTSPPGTKPLSGDFSKRSSGIGAAVKPAASVKAGEDPKNPAGGGNRFQKPGSRKMAKVLRKVVKGGGGAAGRQGGQPKVNKALPGVNLRRPLLPAVVAAKPEQKPKQQLTFQTKKGAFPVGANQPGPHPVAAEDKTVRASRRPPKRRLRPFGQHGLRQHPGGSARPLRPVLNQQLPQRFLPVAPPTSTASNSRPAPPAAAAAVVPSRPVVPAPAVPQPALTSVIPSAALPQPAKVVPFKPAVLLDGAPQPSSSPPPLTSPELPPFGPPVGLDNFPSFPTPDFSSVFETDFLKNFNFDNGSSSRAGNSEYNRLKRGQVKGHGGGGGGQDVSDLDADRKVAAPGLLLAHNPYTRYSPSAHVTSA